MPEPYRLASAKMGKATLQVTWGQIAVIVVSPVVSNDLVLVAQCCRIGEDFIHLHREAAFSFGALQPEYLPCHAI